MTFFLPDPVREWHADPTVVHPQGLIPTIGVPFTFLEQQKQTTAGRLPVAKACFMGRVGGHDALGPDRRGIRPDLARERGGGRVDILAHVFTHEIPFRDGGTTAVHFLLTSRFCSICSSTPGSM